MNKKVTSFSTLATFLYAARTIHEMRVVLAAVKWPFSWPILVIPQLFVFTSSLQYLETCFHFHRFLKSTINKKIKIMFSCQRLSCVCLCQFCSYILSSIFHRTVLLKQVSVVLFCCIVVLPQIEYKQTTFHDVTKFLTNSQPFLI